MSFKEDHPDYKRYSSSHLHYSNLPYNFSWSELESLIDEAGGPDRELLSKVVQKIATKTRAGSVSSGAPYQWIEYVASKIRERVKGGKFHVLMDCLAILCDDGELSTETINEFLEDYHIGYRAYSGGWNHGVVWEKIDSEDEDDSTEEGESDEENSIDEDYFDKKVKDVNNIMGENKKPAKIFITHSNKDTDYVLILTEFLRRLNVPYKSIVCTSDPRHKIPNGENAYAWLKRQFIDSRLHMIFVLSENYYDSMPCLNEMGAAWLVAEKSDLLLLPGFRFSDLKKKEGCLDKDIQGGSIDSEDGMLKAWLTNLRNDVKEEFGLDDLNEFDWEDYRNEFISKMRSVKKTAASRKDTERTYGKEEGHTDRRTDEDL